jgi:hypothetical protein
MMCNVNVDYQTSALLVALNLESSLFRHIIFGAIVGLDLNQFGAMILMLRR